MKLSQPALTFKEAHILDAKFRRKLDKIRRRNRRRSHQLPTPRSSDWDCFHILWAENANRIKRKHARDNTTLKKVTRWIKNKFTGPQKTLEDPEQKEKHLAPALDGTKLCSLTVEDFKSVIKPESMTVDALFTLLYDKVARFNNNAKLNNEVCLIHPKYFNKWYETGKLQDIALLKKYASFYNSTIKRYLMPIVIRNHFMLVAIGTNRSHVPLVFLFDSKPNKTDPKVSKSDLQTIGKMLFPDYQKGPVVSIATGHDILFQSVFDDINSGIFTMMNAEVLLSMKYMSCSTKLKWYYTLSTIKETKQQLLMELIRVYKREMEYKKKMVEKKAVDCITKGKTKTEVQEIMNMLEKFEFDSKIYDQ